MFLKDSLATLLAGTTLLAMALPVRGEEPVEKPRAVYQPAGAIADPQVPARWNRYHNYDEATELLQQLAEKFPGHCRLQSLGKSYGDREMWLLTITNHERGEELEKSAFWIDGGIHANEIQTVEVVLYTAWYLAEGYGRIPEITRLVDERVFYLMPMMSPDSRDAHMNEPNTTHSPRSGQRPVDDDRDGLVDEDRPDDLNNDGHITQMRIADPNGRHKPHPDFPQMMIPVEPGEKGSYTLLGTEGFDNDGDGRVNEDGDGFYDPNRDWAWNWQPRRVQWGAHHYPFSIEENRLVADFVMAHPNIAGAHTYHNTGGMLLRGPGAKSDEMPASDVAVYDFLGKNGEQILPGYRYISMAHDLYEGYGSEMDWFYGMRGVFTFTNELNAPFNFFREAPDGSFFARPEMLHKFNRYLLFNEGFVDWQEVDHPQFGKIEVGGFKKNWNRQPPSFLLEEECHRNMAFSLFHADAMPKVEVQSIDVRPLENGLHEVTAVVVNPKRTPTHSARDLQHKLTPPNRVTIEADDLEVITALTAKRIVFDEPEEQKRNPQTVRVNNITQERPVYVRWIVRGAGPYQVTVRSHKGGVHTLSSGEREP